MTASELADLRARYADLVLAKFGVIDEDLRAAFASVPRERFLGPGPWRIVGLGGYHDSAGVDPREVYVDRLVALDAAREINNGEPGAHASWIHALQLKRGDRVVHVGAGAGYYTAILAELVGREGRVDAYEIDAGLASRARINLAERPNVAVHSRSASQGPLPRADAIYVNAGAAAPLPAWLDALDVGGRLEFPLTSENRLGGMFLFTRSENALWPARMVSRAGFIPLVGGRNSQSSASAAAAFAGGRANAVRWFARDSKRSERDWLSGDGWRLIRGD